MTTRPGEPWPILGKIASMSDEVLVERRGAVQVIVINRPAARNALNLAVRQESGTRSTNSTRTTTCAPGC